MGGDYDNTVNLAKHTTKNRLLLVVLLSFLTVVESGAVACGDLLNARKKTAAELMEKSPYKGNSGDRPLTWPTQKVYT